MLSSFGYWLKGYFPNGYWPDYYWPGIYVKKGEYSAADLYSVETAIIELATGQRVSRVVIADKLIEYHQTDLDTLRDLRAEIRAEIAAADGTKKFFRAKSCKGF